MSYLDIFLRNDFTILTDDDDDDDSDGGVGGYGMGEDSDDGRDYSWKKTIMIGPSFQASVPGGLSSYGDTLPYGKFRLTYRFSKFRALLIITLNLRNNVSAIICAFDFCRK